MIVFTKRQFIDELQKQIHDDEIIMLTRDISGSVTAGKKGLKANFTFAADADLKIIDLMRGKLFLSAIAVTTREHVSDKVKKLL